MKMLPDDALDRLIEGSKKVADLCRQNKVQQWEIIATQSYGHQLDIEAGKISLEMSLEEMGELATEAVQQAEWLSRKKGVGLSFK